MTSARFWINSSPSSDRGYDAVNDETLSLQLESTDGVYQVEFSVFDPLDPDSPGATAGAPLLTLAPSTGVPTTVDSPVTVTMPASGSHAWIVRCVVNGGFDRGNRGVLMPDWVFERVVVIRTETGLAKLVPGESTQYSARGWIDRVNQLIELFATSPVVMPYTFSLIDNTQGDAEYVLPDPASVRFLVLPFMAGATYGCQLTRHGSETINNVAHDLPAANSVGQGGLLVLSTGTHWWARGLNWLEPYVS